MIGRLLTLAWCTMLYLAAAPGATGAESRSAAALYNEGNALYRNGEYDGAVERYRSALETGLENADLYYNLGNAYFKLGSIGRAALNYERARRLAPDDPDILANIEVVEDVRQDRFDSDPPNAVTRFLTSVYSALSPDGLAVWVSVTFLLTCASLGRLMFRPARRLPWVLAAALGLAGAGAGTAVLAVKVSDLNTPRAIVLASSTTGRSGPGDEFLQVFVLHEGTPVTVERREGAWALVHLPNGIGGWIRQDAFEQI